MSRTWYVSAYRIPPTSPFPGIFEGDDWRGPSPQRILKDVRGPFESAQEAATQAEEWMTRRRRNFWLVLVEDGVVTHCNKYDSGYTRAGRAALSKEEAQLWRHVACMDNTMRETCLRPEALSRPANNLTEGDLRSPWTPDLLLGLWWVQAVTQAYDHWSTADEPPEWLTRNRASSAKGSIPEQVFETAGRKLAKAALSSFVSWVMWQAAIYTRRVLHLRSNERWVPFQIDLNSPSIFRLIERPDQWQVVVDECQEDKGSSSSMSFLRDMAMASVSYIEEHIPGSYGVSTSTPSFGYRREHQSPVLFVGWATSVMPANDLFGSRFWKDLR